jgi:hypothetical protein
MQRYLPPTPERDVIAASSDIIFSRSYVVEMAYPGCRRSALANRTCSGKRLVRRKPLRSHTPDCTLHLGHGLVWSRFPTPTPTIMAWVEYVRYTVPAATHEGVQQGARREILKAGYNAQESVKAHSESQFTLHLHALKQHTAALTSLTAIPYQPAVVEKWLRHYLQQQRVSACMAMGA